MLHLLVIIHPVYYFIQEAHCNRAVFFDTNLDTQNDLQFYSLVLIPIYLQFHCGSDVLVQTIESCEGCNTASLSSSLVSVLKINTRLKEIDRRGTRN